MRYESFHCHTLLFHIPNIFEVILKSSIAGESEKQSLQLEYIIIQSIKSVSIWNKSPIPMMLKGLRKKSSATYTIIA